jgi:DNA-binding LacI/PurR family transcriptional regulator
MSVTLRGLAARLERDIRNRGLAPGHPYLTGEESARLLGTSVASANRALRMLAENQIVVRQRSTGTVVGPALANKNATLQAATVVSVLVPDTERQCRTFPIEPLIDTLIREMSDVTDVRISYVPVDHDLEFVKHLIEESMGTARLAGVIAVSCSFEVYEYLGRLGCPFVVGGSLYPGQSIPSVGTDERLAGKLLAEHLVEQGHRRMALFSDSEARPGDHHFHDGVSEALTKAGLPHNSMLLRTPGTSRVVLRAQVNELLGLPDPPSGFILRVYRWADEVAEVVRARGLRMPQDVEIVFKDYQWFPTKRLDYTHVRTTIPHEAMMQLLGKTLIQIRQRVALDSSTIERPFELCRASEASRRQSRKKAEQ